jgi:Cu-Zn family superoxide dismutase
VQVGRLLITIGEGLHRPSFPVYLEESMKCAALLFTVSSLFLLGSVQSSFGQTAGDQQAAKAVAVLNSVSGSGVTGVVTFTRVDNGVKVVADVQGLTPGKHGFHVHQYGDCSAPNGDSAGGHFNPEGKPHGAPVSGDRHVGDLGNIAAGEDGKAHYEWTDHMIAFEGRDSIIGRGLIVHANADDLVTQPAGNSGPKVACGVIGIAAK